MLISFLSPCLPPPSTHAATPDCGQRSRVTLLDSTLWQLHSKMWSVQSSNVAGLQTVAKLLQTVVSAVEFHDMFE